MCRDGTRVILARVTKGHADGDRICVCGIGEVTLAHISGKVKSNLVTSSDVCRFRRLETGSP